MGSVISGLSYSQEQVVKKSFGNFTGEILPVFYTSNSIRSQEFYTKVGFELIDYFDYELGESVTEWTKSEQPIYLTMAFGTKVFGIHLIKESDSLIVGGMIHYFGVENVDIHYKIVVSNGIDASDIVDRPWMRMFYVKDPDGHILYFFTRPNDWE